MQGAWRRWEGRGQRITGRAEKGRPRGPHTGRTGLGRGGDELRNAESIQPSSQEADPPIPTLSISLEGVASGGFRDPSPAAAAEAWQPLVGHPSACLCIHLSAALRSRQETQTSSLPSLCLFLKFPEMDREGQGDAGNWEHRWGWGVWIRTSYSPPHDHRQGRSRAGGARQPGDARLPQGRAGISKLEARGHVSQLCEPAPITA